MFNNGQYGPKWFKTVQNGPKQFLKNGPKRSKLVNNCQQRSTKVNMVKNGQKQSKWSKMVKNSQFGQKPSIRSKTVKHAQKTVNNSKKNSQQQSKTF